MIAARASSMMKPSGGPGLLMGGIAGVPNAKVVILGGGVAGQEAARVASGEVALDASRGLEETVRALCAVPGVGAWTAHYIAMRALREPDAFPATDLGLRRALGGVSGAVEGSLDLPRGALDLRFLVRPGVAEAPPIALRVTGPAAKSAAKRSALACRDKAAEAGQVLEYSTV